MGIRFRKTKKAGPFRFSLTKKGVGWSIGNKYIGYSHGASGRKSLRASIPGTGISYIAPLAVGKKRKKKTSARKTRKRITIRTEVKENQNVRVPEMPKKNANSIISSQKPANGKLVAGIAAAVIGISALSGGGSDDTTPPGTNAAVETVDIESINALYLPPETEASIPEPETKPETEPPETRKPETKAPETKTPETKAPETKPETKAPAVVASSETKASETKKPETDPPETKKPETKAPETQKPETKAPETKPPETQAPETKPPITITHKDSTLSAELVEALDGVAAFWAPTGKKIHLDPFCWSFHEVKYAGTVAEANSVKDGGWCGSCSKGANENTKSNPKATPEVIASCYSYQDYINGIPAGAFD